MIVLYIILAAFVVFLLYCAWETKTPELNNRTVSSKRLPLEFDGFRIAHISDFHNTVFGKDNKRLIELVSKSSPDIIAITGDLIDFRKINVDAAFAFAQELVKIAPTYYVAGNHEARSDKYEELFGLLCSVGVKILNNKSENIEHKGAFINIMGIKDPAFCENFGVSELQIIKSGLAELLCGCGTDLGASPNCAAPREENAVRASEERIASITEESRSIACMDDGSFKILLLHRPQYIDCCAEAKIDLVLSGHAHGGQIRIPFLGGLLAPEQGFFPEYDAGVYSKGETWMVVSRGLGNSVFPLRINNRPEIVLIELKNKTNT